ncbi:MAG: hypothetical protein NDI69_07180 [Bacteriovoracaceae bacterium]|nr:hypothetical protein [Bacteriovoracaceae bacterium]
MKYILMMLLSFSAWADITLEDAYIRERSFLLAQKDGLLKMKNNMMTSLDKRKSKAEKDIALKQAELSRLMLKNQELHEDYKTLEKMTKESSQMSGQLEKNDLKIQEKFQTIRSKLGISHAPSTESDVIKKFEATLNDAFGLIEALSTEKWRSHAFLDENGHLIQGEVLFQGLFSARGKKGSEIFVLAPYNDEFLKVISSAEANEILLFSPDFERTGLKVAKSWKESVADAIPGIVMAIIMMAVLGLFILLARA